MKVFKENKFGVIEDMSSLSHPLTSFNVYRKREDSTRRNPRVFYRSAYTTEKAIILLNKLLAVIKR